MTDLKKRVIAGVLGLSLSLALVACSSNEDPSNTTPPGDSDTTAPVGS